MPTPDIPSFNSPEGELRQPRNGLKMAVRFTDRLGRPLLPTQEISPAAGHRTNLEMLGTDYKPTTVYIRPYEQPSDPNAKIKNSILTVYEYLRTGRFEFIPPEHRLFASMAATELQFDVEPEKRAYPLVRAESSRESLYPELFGGENIHQFLIIEKHAPLIEN